jgi:hypothetical protein
VPSLSLIRTATLATALIAAGVGTAFAAQQQQAQAPNASSQAAATSRNDSHGCTQPNTPSIRSMRWGYYPGYGCGPVPSAQTVYP